jgi:putative DNA primase/helicase
MGIRQVNEQGQDAEALLRQKIKDLHLEGVDDVRFQAHYAQWAEELSCSKSFLKSEHKKARAKFGAFFKAHSISSGAAANPNLWSETRFKFLGVRGEDAYFLDNRNQVISGPPSRQRLLQLEDANLWRKNWPGAKDGTTDWDGVISDVAERARQAGIFDPTWIHGRGAWLEPILSNRQQHEDLVLHCGDRLLIAGQRQELGQRSYIYAAGPPLGLPPRLPPPLSIEGCKLISQAVGGLHWRSPLDAPLLIGWLVVAVLGGALSWRPHLWLTGAKGSGKTFLIDRLIRPLLRFHFPFFDAGTTEAGIRQDLKSDSLPWVLDEADPRDETGRQRIQKILTMLRGNSSSSNQVHTSKGTTTGKAMSFGLRSCALLASILISAEDDADTSRLTQIELLPSTPAEYAAMAPVWASITPELGWALFTRIVTFALVLLKNISVFRAECATRLGDSRKGDQYGTLLAGAHFLEHDNEVTPQEAAAYLDGFKWGEHQAGSHEDESDENRCLQAILGVHVDVNVRDEILPSHDDGPSRVRSIRDKRTLAELVDVVLEVKDDAVTMEDARNILNRFGLRVEAELDGTRLWVANNNDTLAKALSGHVWARYWRRYLCRLPGAIKSDKPQKFAGVSSRYVSLPLTVNCVNCQTAHPPDSSVCRHCAEPIRETEAPF